MQFKKLLYSDSKMIKIGPHNIIYKSNQHNQSLKVWCSNVTDADLKWQEYRRDGWNIIEPLKVKWEWKRFSYSYYFKISKIIF